MRSARANDGCFTSRKLPPAEAEMLFYSQEDLVGRPGLKEWSLDETRELLMTTVSLSR